MRRSTDGTRAVGPTAGTVAVLLVSELVASTTSFEVSGWPALLVPVGAVLLLGLLLDALSGTRR